MPWLPFRFAWVKVTTGHLTEGGKTAKVCQKDARNELCPDFMWASAEHLVAICYTSYKINRSASYLSPEQGLWTQVQDHKDVICNGNPCSFYIFSNLCFYSSEVPLAIWLGIYWNWYFLLLQRPSLFWFLRSATLQLQSILAVCKKKVLLVVQTLLRILEYPLLVSNLLGIYIDSLL